MATLLALTFIFMPIKEVFAYEPTENIKKVNKQEKYSKERSNKFI